MTRRVVVTAAEAITAAGIGRSTLSKVLRSDRCVGSSGAFQLPIERVARVLDDVPIHTDFLDDRKSHLGWLAAELAWTRSGLGEGIKDRPVVFVGTGLSSITPFEMNEDLLCHIVDGRFDRDAMAKDLRTNLAAPRRHLPHYFGEKLGDRFNASRSGSNFSACAAASQAIGSGFWAVRRGEADIAVVGGHDSMDHPIGLLSFQVLGALSPSFCRPFDRSRDGFMLGEGAGFLILEERERAIRRGAPILAEILGAGTSMDAWNPTAPHPEGTGAEMAMRRALKDAKVLPEQVNYVNAHGTGTPLGDAAESKAIQRVFNQGVKVSSIKGSIGHCIAAAGAVETVACVDMIVNGWMAGTVGLQDLDRDCTVQVLQCSLDKSPSVVVSNSFGFGGQNASLVLSAI